MPHATTFTYDLASTDALVLQIGYVRHRINDKDASQPIFVDAEIEVSLILEDYNIRCAAAYCLETIASNEVLVQKVIKILQLSTDGAKVAAELRAQAKELRAQSDATSAQGEASFDIAEWIVNDFSYREHLLNEAIRAG